MSLIRRAKNDPIAFSELYEGHVQSVYRYFASRVQKKDAEDLTSQVWETVLKNIQNLKGDTLPNFRAWLFTIVRHSFHKYLQAQPVGSLEEHEYYLKSDDPLPNELSQQNQDCNEIRTLLNGLPKEQRETVVLRYYSDLRNKEIAELLSVSEKTVASNLSRALFTLRSLWKKLQ